MHTRNLLSSFGKNKIKNISPTYGDKQNISIDSPELRFMFPRSPAAGPRKFFAASPGLIRRTGSVFRFLEPAGELESPSADYKSAASPSMLGGRCLVDRAGFEPAVDPFGVSGFTVRRLQPLSHLSVSFSALGDSRSGIAFPGAAN